MATIGAAFLVATRSRAVEARRLEEALLAHPLVVEHLAEIARAVVVEDDHHVSPALNRRQLQQSGHRGAGRVAGEDPFLRAIRRVLIAASLSVTFSKWSTNEKSTFFGRKSSPIPSVTYG